MLRGSFGSESLSSLSSGPAILVSPLIGGQRPAGNDVLARIAIVLVMLSWLAPAR